MPRAEEEAMQAVTREDGTHDWEAFQAAYQAALKRRQEKLVTEAWASFRALDGWGTVRRPRSRAGH